MHNSGFGKVNGVFHSKIWIAREYPTMRLVYVIIMAHTKPINEHLLQNPAIDGVHRTRKKTTSFQKKWECLMFAFPVFITYEFIACDVKFTVAVCLFIYWVDVNKCINSFNSRFSDRWSKMLCLKFSINWVHLNQ